jgi:hypothetical protein
MGTELIPFLTSLEVWGNKWMRDGSNITDVSAAAK